MLWTCELVKNDPARPWVVLEQRAVTFEAPDDASEAVDRAVEQFAGDGWTVGEWTAVRVRDE